MMQFKARVMGNLMSRRTLVVLIAVPIAAMLCSALLLTAVFGPTDNGVRCSRTAEGNTCEVRQTRFFGLAGNTSFFIPESSIRSAQSLCSSSKMGGHAGTSCNVYLSLESGQNYLVIGYGLRSRAEASANQLNRYFRDKAIRSVEIHEDLLTPVLLEAAVPLLGIGLIAFAARKWRKQRLVAH
jgi:hypothetical protein